MFKAQVEKSRILLDWQSPESSDLTGINIYRSMNSDKGFVKLNSKPLKAGSTTYTDKTAAPGVTYWYYATSVDKEGNESGMSLMTLAKVADTSPPKRPKGLSAAVAPGLANLSWEPAPEADIRGYRLYRSMDPGAETWLMLNQVPVRETTYSDVMPQTGSSHPLYYRVTAVDLEYNESKPSKPLKVVLPDVTPPSQPIWNEAVANEGEIKITWHRPGDSDLAGYNIFRRTAPAKEPLRLNSRLIDADILQYTDDEALIPGTDYEYILQAVDETGNVSVSSRPITLRTFDGTSPEPPGSFKAESIHSGEGILVTWEIPDGENLKGVILYRAKTEDGIFYPLTDFTREGSFLDEKVRDGRTYWYRLAAFDASNNRSEFSQTVKATFERKPEEPAP